MHYLNGFGTTAVNPANGSANGGGYTIMPIDPLPVPVVTGTPPPVTTPPVTNPLAGIMGMLDGEVMGIPVKYIALAAVAYFFMKK